MALAYLLLEELLREEQDERANRRRLLRQNFVLHNIPDVEFILNYRLNRVLFEELCRDVIPFLPARRHPRGLDPIVMILTALNFYARGSYQGSVALNQDTPMVQQTVSQCLKEVTIAINHPSVVAKYIRFPQNLTERNKVKREFFQQYGVPGVVGCIDCTHVAIIRPRDHEERFFNRKHFHSLNVQAVCDAECNLLNVDASYGGATHDSFIWSSHEIKEYMENLDDEMAYLLGDSGYPVREYMMTPIDNANEDSPEGRYNKIQKRARCTIERTFGIFKGRFRCLLAARKLHYCPEKAGKIVIACSVLHNMCNRAGLEAPILTEEDMQNERNSQESTVTATTPIQALRQGKITRRRLVQLLEQNSNTEHN